MGVLGRLFGSGGRKKSDSGYSKYKTKSGTTIKQGSGGKMFTHRSETPSGGQKAYDLLVRQAAEVALHHSEKKRLWGDHMRDHTVVREIQLQREAGTTSGPTARAAACP